MSAYTIREKTVEAHRVFELRDEGRGHYAHILPAVGATCYEYAVRHREVMQHLLDPPPDLATLVARPTGYGVPILFPFPNRIRNGVWTFEGRRYEFEDKSAGGNHIHGLVYRLPWEVESADADEMGATCVMAFDSTRFEEIGRQYPFPFRLTTRYALREDGLTLTFVAQNVGEDRMPMGVGFHPYYRAPIAPETAPWNCLITVPAAGRWELDAFLPTGRVLPVQGRYDLREGRPFDGMAFDDVFTQLTPDPSSGRVRCTIEDRNIGLRTAVESDSAFREMVLYTPPRRRAICFEPYTCPTDAPNLAARGLDVGLIVLDPGASFTGVVRITAEAL